MSDIYDEENSDRLDQEEDLDFYWIGTSSTPEIRRDPFDIVEEWMIKGVLLYLAYIFLRYTFPDLFSWFTVKVLLILVLILLIGPILWPYGEHGP